MRLKAQWARQRTRNAGRAPTNKRCTTERHGKRKSKPLPNTMNTETATTEIVMSPGKPTARRRRRSSRQVKVSFGAETLDIELTSETSIAATTQEYLISRTGKYRGPRWLCRGCATQATHGKDDLSQTGLQSSVVVVVVVVVVRRKPYNTRLSKRADKMPRVRVAEHLGVKLFGVPATSSPRQPTTVGDRGLLLGPDVRMDGFRKMKQNAAKTPLRHSSKSSPNSVDV